MQLKKELIICILILAILTIGVVSAQEDNNSTAPNNDDCLEISDESQIIKESEHDFVDVQNMVNSANAGSEITLNGMYYGNGTHITISKSLTIDGKGSTMEAYSGSRMFYISNNAQLTFKNIIFQNGWVNGDGGAIWGNNYNVVNCTFINCIANNGGALYKGTATDCKFINCDASNGGAIYGGSAIRCTFDGNSASAQGGAMYEGSALDCNFTNDTYYNTNISYSAYVSINNIDAYVGDTRTINVTVKDYFGKPVNGLVIIKIAGCLIDRIYLENGSISINHTFDYECYRITVEYLGSGNYLKNYTDVGINVRKATSSKSFSELYDKLITSYGLDSINLDSDYAFNPSTDSAYINGISISRDLTIYGRNHTINGLFKAKIFNVASNVNVIFRDINFVQGYSSNGGAVSGGTAYNCVFKYNIATNNGGATYNTNMYNCTLMYNTAKNGGASYGGSSYNSHFEKNIATVSGGAIHSSTVHNSYFIGNRIYYYDHAVYGGAASSSTIYDSYFYNNKALNAVLSRDYMSYGGTTYLGTAYNCTFVLSEAKYGGIDYGGTAYNSTFINGTADYGGAMYKSRANACIFITNKATKSGPPHDNGGNSLAYCDIFNYCNFTKYVSVYFGSEVLECKYYYEYNVIVEDLIGCGEYKTFSIKVTDYAGQPVSGKEISFSYLNEYYKSNLVNGSANFTIFLPMYDYVEEVSIRCYGNYNPDTKVKFISKSQLTYAKTFKDLNNLIVNANNDDVIELSDNYIYNDSLDSSYKSGISITKNLTINGNNKVINAYRVSRLFNINADVTLTINNIIFTQNDREQFAIYNTKGKVYVSDSTFTYCFPTLYNTTVNNCVFINCSSRDYGIVRYGLIYNSLIIGGDSMAVREAYCVNCTFKDTCSGFRGVAVDSTVINSTFSNCSIKEYGNAYYPIVSSGLIDNCTFIDCTGNWGVISRATVNNSLLINCSAVRAGAAYISNVTNSKFIDCHATMGGALYEGSCVNSTFINCQATDGGATYNTDILNSTFISCSAVNGGSARKGTATNSTFINSFADYGGAMYEGSAIKCTFINCSSGLVGGALNNTDVINCTILNSTENLNFNTTLIVNGNTFEDIQKSIDNAREGNTIILNGNFTGNGTAIKVNKKVTIIGNNTVLDAKGLSGIFYLGNFKVENVTFINIGFNDEDGSSAVSYGTAINCIFKNISNKGRALGQSTAINCTFSDLIVSDYISSYSSIYNSTFINCSAKTSVNSYGLVYYSPCVNTTFINCSGKLCYYSDVVNCTFENVSSSWYMIDHGSVSNSTFINCHDSSKPILNYVSASDCIFVNCYSSGADGGVMDHGSAVNCNFMFCSGFEGGALYQAQATNCTFINCSARMYGGAMYGGSAVNSTFINCSAGMDGGAVYNTKTTNCVFNNCHARTGGAIYGSTSINSTIYLNSGDNIDSLVYGYSAENIFNNFRFILNYNSTLITLKSYNYETDDTINVIAKVSSTDYVNDGNITLSINGKILTTCEVENGFANITYKCRESGEFTVLVSYSGEYPSASTTFNLLSTAEKSDSQIIVSVDSENYTNLVKFEFNMVEDATGNVSVLINNNQFTTILNNGKAVINVSNLAGGSYSALITYSGNEIYKLSNKTVEFTIASAKKDTTITMQNLDVIIGDYVNLTASINSDDVVSEGSVIFYVNGVNVGTASVVNGKASYRYLTSQVGTYNVLAVYNGSNYYNPSNTTSVLSVNLDEYEIIFNSNVIGNVVNITVSVLNHNGEHVDDNLGELRIFKDNDYLRGGDLEFNDHVASLSIELEDEDYSFKVKFEDAYGRGNYTANITVLGTQQRLNSYVIINIDYGMLSINLPNNASGNLKIELDSEIFTQLIMNNIVYLNISNLNAGMHNVTVYYSGDMNYLPCSNSTLFTVNKTKSFGNMEVDVNNAYYGEDVVVSVSLDGDATGVVNLRINGDSYTEVVVKGKANFIISNLDVGMYDGIVYYYGDENYYDCQRNVSFLVKSSNGTSSKINTIIFVNASDIYEGDDAIIRISLLDEYGMELNEIVSVVVDGRSYNNVSNKLYISNLSVGLHSVQVYYDGNEYYLASTNSTMFSVVKSQSNTFANIQNLINMASAYETINLDNDYVGTGEAIIVNKPIIINGNGHVLDANFSSRIFNINSSDVTLSNLILVNGYDVEAGAVLLNGNNGLISNVIFMNNQANDGAGIVINGNAAMIVNSIFEDNYAKYMAAGVKVTGSETLISNSVFSGNVASEGAGIVVDARDTLISNSTFINNYAGSGAACLIEANNVLVENSTFISNKANDAGAGIVVDGYGAIINNSAFINNSARIAAGIYCVNNAQVVNSLFENCTASLGSAMYGGSAYQCVFIGNSEPVTSNTNIIGGKTQAHIILSADTYEVSLGNNISINIQIADENGNIIGGNVSLYINDVLIGQITSGDNFTYLPEYSGLYVLNAIFDGDANYLEAYSNITFNVVSGKIDPIINIEASNIIYGDTLTVNVDLPYDATGYVVITVKKDNSNSHSSNGTSVPDSPIVFSKFLVDGKAQFNISDLSVGLYNVTVEYAGDENYLSAINTTQIQVSAKVKDNPMMSVVVNNITFGDDLCVMVVFSSNASGNVTLIVSTTTLNIPIVNGVALANISGLASGKYRVIASYLGDDNYESDLIVGSVSVVDKLDSVVTIDDVDLVIGESVTFTAKLNGVSSNDIVFVVNGVEGNYVDNVVAGTYNVVALFSGNATHKATNSTRVFTAGKVNGEIANVSVVVGLNTTIYVKMGGPVNDMVIISINDVNYTALINDEGVASLSLPLEDGSYVVTVYYLGNEYYGAASPKSVSFTVLNNVKITPVMFVNASDIINGDNLTVIVTLPSNATGFVTFSVSGKVYNVAVVNGNASTSISGLDVGSFNIVVSYSGDENYESTSSSCVVNVYDKLDSVVTIDDVDLVIGESVTFTAKLNGVSSNDLIFVVNGVEGNYVDNVVAGTYNVVALFGGNATHKAANSTRVFTVGKVNGEIANVSVVVGLNTTIYVKMGGPVNDMVIISINDVNYTALINDEGVASLSLPLEDGSYVVTVYYLGNEYYGATSPKSVSFTVLNNVKITPVMFVNASDITNGDNLTVIVTLPSDATGKVTVHVDAYAIPSYYGNGTGGSVLYTNQSDFLVGGMAQFNVSGLVDGIYNVTVVYGGDEKYLSCVNTTFVSVNPKVKELPTMIVIVNNITSGDILTINVALPSDATGSVNVNVEKSVDASYSVNGTDMSGSSYINSKWLVDGKAQFNVSDLSSGIYNITVSYSGDGNYLSCENSTSVKVSPKVKEVPIMSVSANDITYGDDLNVSVILPGDATGFVTFSVSGKVYNVVGVVNGNASTSISGLDVGSFNIVVSYSGDENYYANQQNISFVVKSNNGTVSKIKTSIFINVSDIYDGDVAVIGVCVVDDYDIVLNTVVDVYVNGVVYNLNTSSSLSISGLSVGEYVVFVTFSGDEYYLSSSQNATFIVVNSQSNTFSSIQNLINMASSYDVINLDEDYVGTGEAIVIDKEITINGNGHVLDANFSSRIFNISSNNVVLANITLINGYDVEAGAVLVNGDNALISNVVVNNNQANDGAGIVINGNAAMLVNCIFEDNYAKYTAAGVKVNGNETLISNSVFINNLASAGAGVVVDARDALISNSTFINNYAGSGAACLVEADNVLVENSTFISNKANGTGAGIVVDGYGVIINNSAFISNSARIGAGIYGVNSTQVVNSLFENCTAMQGSAMYGGSAYQCVFTDNSEPVIYNTNIIGGKTQAYIILSTDDYEVSLGNNISINIQVVDENSNIINGNVSLYINGMLIGQITSGNNFIYLPEYSGLYVLTAIFDGDANYLEAYSNITFNVVGGKTTPIINIEASNIVYGDNLTVIVTLPVDATGIVNAVIVRVISGVNFTNSTGGIIINGTGVNLSNLTGDIIVSGNGTGVNLSNLTGDIIVSGNGTGVNLSNSTEVNVNGSSIGSNSTGYLQAYLVNGKAYFTFTGLDVGNYNITVVYDGDEKYSDSSNSTLINVSSKVKEIPLMSVSANNITYDEDVVINVSLPSNATGFITFSVSGKVYNVVGVVNGNALSNISGLDVGLFDILVSYSGDENYESTSSSCVVNVYDKLDSVVTIDNVDLVIGESVTFTAKLNGVSSNDLVFVVNGVEGNYVDNVVAGTYTVVALFGGNATHKAANSTRVFTVAKKTGVIAGVSVEPVFVGANSTVVVNMNSTESGYVVVLIDGVNYNVVINEGVAVLNVALGVGNHTVVAYYLGDEFYSNSTSVSSVVNVYDKLDSVVTIDDVELVIGKVTTFTAKLNGNVNNNIVIIVNGVESASVNISAGSYTVVAYFAGNVTHKSANATRTFVIGKGNVTVTIDDVNLTLGESATFTGKINGVKADLIFTINSEVSNVIDSVNAIDYVVIASFIGNATHNSANATRLFHVDKIDSTVSVSNIEFNYGESATSTVNLTGATGVIATIDGYSDAVNVNGNVINVSSLPAGTYTLSVTTVPDSNHNSVTATATVRVNKVDSSVIVNPIVFTYTESGNATFTLNGATDVIVNVIGQNSSVVKVVDNLIIVSNLKTGSYVLSVVTVPDSNHTAITVNTTVIVNPIIINNDNFNDYFDENGVLTSTKDELMFSGSFNNLTLTIKNPVTLLSQNAIFTNVKFNIESDNVSMSDMIFNYVGEDSIITVKDVSNFKFEDNTIVYTGNSNNYVINITNSSNVDLIGNFIRAKGNNYVHGVLISADNFNIENNTILISEVENACGINIMGPSSGIVLNNYLNIRASKNIYSINTNPATGSLRVGYIKNSINAEAYFVVGIYDDSEEIRQNNLNLSGNYVVGVVVLSNSTVDGNEILVNASNEGDEDIPEDIGNSTGIQVKNNATITNNKVNSNSKSISVLEGNSDISNNDLVGTMNVASDGNIISGNIIATEEEYAIDLGASSGNTVTTNEFYSEGTDPNSLVKSQGENNVYGNLYKSIVVVDHDIEFQYNSSGSTNFTITGATGIITHVINHTEAKVNITDDLIIVSNLSTGIYVLNITTKPIENYSTTTIFINVNVTKANSLITITVCDGIYNTTNATVEIGVVNKTNISFNITKDGVSVGSGDVSKLNVTLASLSAGEYNITVVNAENENYASSSDSKVFNIAKASSLVNVSPIGDVNYGNPISVVYNVVNASVVTYVVKIRNGETVIPNTTVSEGIIIPVLAAGNYTLVVANKETENFTGDNKEVNFTIIKAKSNVVINVENGVYNTVNATVEISVVNKTNISFNITKDGVSVGSGDVSKLNATLASLSAGEYNITVVNAENENYASSSDSKVFNIAKASSLVNVSPIGDVNYGNPISVVYNVVNASVVTYVVKIRNGETVIPNTTVSEGIIIPVLAAGNYTLVVANKETENFTGDIKEIDFTINKIPSTIIFSNNITFVYGESGSTTITLNGAIIKNITVVGHTEAVINLEGNIITVSNLTAGEHILNVTTTPDANHTASIGLTNINVTKANPNLNITIANVDERNPIIVSVTSSKTFTGDVIVKVAGKDVLVQINNGTGLNASTGLILPASIYKANITFAGNTNFTSDYSETTFSVKADPIDPGLSVSVADIKYGENAVVLITTNTAFTGSVNVKVDNTNYVVNVVNGAGRVSVSALAAGSHRVVVTLSATDSFTESVKLASFKVNDVISLVLKSVSVKKSAKKLTLQATLKINKKAVKGKKITFKFNGKKYTAKTNKKGVAKVTIKKAVLKKLKVGKKIKYQATYLKYSVSKSVKVKK